MDAWGEATTMSNTELFAEPNLNLKSPAKQTGELLEAEQPADYSGATSNSNCSAAKQVHTTAPSKSKTLTAVKTVDTHVASSSNLKQDVPLAQDSLLKDEDELLSETSSLQSASVINISSSNACPMFPPRDSEKTADNATNNTSGATISNDAIVNDAENAIVNTTVNTKAKASTLSTASIANTKNADSNSASAFVTSLDYSDSTVSVNAGSANNSSNSRAVTANLSQENASSAATSTQHSSKDSNANPHVNKSKPLIASNVSSMLNFFSAQMKTVEQTDTAHAQKINNFIDSYLATGFAAQKKNKALSELDLSNTLNSTKAKAAEVAAHMNVEQTDLILSPFLRAPDQISFTNVLPLQAFSSMTTFLDDSPEIEPLHSHESAASAASKLTLSSPTTMQESVTPLSANDLECNNLGCNNLYANDLGNNDLNVNDVSSNNVNTTDVEAKFQNTFHQSKSSTDNIASNTALKHGVVKNNTVSHMSNTDPLSPESFQAKDPLPSTASSQGTVTKISKSSHMSQADDQVKNQYTIDDDRLQIANSETESAAPAQMSQSHTVTTIPHLKHGSRYIQVSTEGLMDQLDPEVFLQPPIDTLDIFKDQSALSSSSTYSLHDKSVLKADLYNKRQSLTKVHEPFGEISSVLMPTELHSILNHVIKNHERYRHNAHPELLTCVGYWCYDREEGGFSIDKATAHLLGIKNYQEIIPMEKLHEYFEPRHVERIIYNHENVEAGMVFTDRLRLISGPYAGLTMITQGSAVIRDPETEQVLISSGLICFEGCPQAEFLFREITGDGMFVWNAENDSVLFSSSYHAMLGYTKNEFPTSFTGFCQQLVHPDDYDSLLIQQHVVRSPAYGNSFETCIRLKHRNGNYLWTIGRGLVLERNHKGVATQLIGSQTNIDIVHQSFDTINSLMFTDSLTELHNRSYFTQNAVRYEHIQHYPMTIIFVDVTGLKLTNDILGHNFGDYLILKCAIGMLQGLQNVFAKTRMYTDLREQLSLIIDNMTRKAFDLIYQDSEQFNQAEKMFTTANNKIRATYPTIKNTSVVSFAEYDDSHPTLKLQMDTIEKMLKNKMQPEVIRLAGDELILLFPSCPIELAQMLKQEIIASARKMNALDRLSFPNETRPVPLCFGIGIATVGDAGPNDNFKQTLERADMRMLENKEKYNEQNHHILKDYFEKRLNREVSMRDSRRETILNASERQELRKQKMKESGGYNLTPPKPEPVKIKPNLQLCE